MRSTLELLKQCPEGLCAYVLIDNSAYDGEWLAARAENAARASPPLVSALTRSGLPLILLRGQLEDEEAAAVAPLLMEWQDTPAGMEVLRRLDALPRGRCAQSILYCAEAVESVAERLRQRMSIALMGDDYLLRYFDTRILHELAPCLTPEQAASFSSFAALWHYRYRDDEWTTLPVAVGPGREMLPLELDDAQREAFLRIGSADRIEAAIGGFLDDNPLDQITPGERYRWICTRQQEAMGQGIVEHVGQVSYCLQVFDSFS
jgi:hypothetical protein